MWDERYGSTEFAYGTAPNDFLAAEAGRLPAGALLELGAGEGRNGVWLAQRGHAVTLVDGSAVGLAKAQALATSRGVAVTTVVADLAAFDLAPGGVPCWQAVVATFVHLPPALRAAVHRAVVAALVPGGVFLLEAYTPAQLAFGTGGPRQPELLMSLESLRDDLAGLDLVVARELERDISEGAFHHGRSAVVQVVGIKR